MTTNKDIEIVREAVRDLACALKTIKAHEYDQGLYSDLAGTAIEKHAEIIKECGG